jgi:hypothetical protein
MYIQTCKRPHYIQIVAKTWKQAKSTKSQHRKKATLRRSVRSIKFTLFLKTAQTRMFQLGIASAP